MFDLNFNKAPRILASENSVFFKNRFIDLTDETMTVKVSSKPYLDVEDAKELEFNESFINSEDSKLKKAAILLVASQISEAISLTNKVLLENKASLLKSKPSLFEELPYIHTISELEYLVAIQEYKIKKYKDLLYRLGYDFDKLGVIRSIEV